MWYGYRHSLRNKVWMAENWAHDRRLMTSCLTSYPMSCSRTLRLGEVNDGFTWMHGRMGSLWALPTQQGDLKLWSTRHIPSQQHTKDSQFMISAPQRKLPPQKHPTRTHTQTERIEHSISKEGLLGFVSTNLKRTWVTNCTVTKGGRVKLQTFKACLRMDLLRINWGMDLLLINLSPTPKFPDTWRLT